MIEVLYEDNHLIAVNKKAGDIVQKDKTNDTPLSDLVKSYLKEKYKKQGNVFLGTIHRIDRPTLGIVLFAKTSKSLARMNELFRDGMVKKTYWAIVENCPPSNEGLLENLLQKNEKQNKSYISKSGKEAKLHYILLKKLNNYFLLEIVPKTGRHHQIRTQLSHIGCPIKGDIKYGAKRTNHDGSINLLARNIEFIHPISGQKIKIKAPIPNDTIWQSCV